LQSDILIEQGATFWKIFEAQDAPEDDWRAAINLPPAADCTARGKVRDGSKNLIATFSASVADRQVPTDDPLVFLNGWTVNIFLNAETTAAVVTPVAGGKYDVEVEVTATGVVYRVAEGKVKVSPEQTY
jgi:hypothetical protein